MDVVGSAPHPSRLSPSVALRRAAVQASRAPSVRNSQPWRFQLTDDTLEVHADPARWLQDVDPRGRQLLMSCGCALLNARAALATAGFQPRTERHPDPERPQVLARLQLSAGAPGPGDGRLAELAEAVDDRQTNRGPFVGSELSPTVLADLVAAAVAEGAELRQVADPLQVQGLLGLSDEVGAGPSPAVLLLLGTPTDSNEASLRAGEAVERTWLTAQLHGLAVRPLGDGLQVPGTRRLLRQELAMQGHPQLLLEVGQAARGPVTRRRRLVEMLSGPL